MDAADGKLMVDFNEEHNRLESVGGSKLMEMQSLLSTIWGFSMWICRFEGKMGVDSANLRMDGKLNDRRKH